MVRHTDVEMTARKEEGFMLTDPGTGGTHGCRATQEAPGRLRTEGWEHAGKGLDGGFCGKEPARQGEQA